LRLDISTTTLYVVPLIQLIPRNTVNYYYSRLSLETMVQKQKHRIWQLVLCVLLLPVLFPDTVSAATLKLIPNITTPNLLLSLEIDKVEKLAGLKISLTYPDKILKFKSAKKTKATSAFMHVVNDKHPGKLIIVMASAKGISGSDMALFDLSFDLAVPSEKAKSATIKTTSCQLMTEDLKELPCETSPYEVKF
jgi:hypothetical protein